MNPFFKLKTHARRAAVLLVACAAVHAAPAQDRPNQDQVVQDGIAVKPLKRNSITGVWRDIAAPEQAINEQSAQQYLALMSKAKQEGALVPESDPQVQRLRAIARRIIPNTIRWNQDAQQWKWQVNLLKSGEVNAFCMPGGRI